MLCSCYIVFIYRGYKIDSCNFKVGGIGILIEFYYIDSIFIMLNV